MNKEKAVGFTNSFFFTILIKKINNNMQEMRRLSIKINDYARFIALMK